MKTYTVTERAQTIYQTVVGVFDYNSSSDVVTPAALIESQIDSLPSLEGKILVPGAGIGSYVNALIQRGVKPGKIYAVEISPSYCRLGSRMFSRLGVNYILADYLTWDPKMQFDIIIGNPPYQAPRNEKGAKLYPLWKKFLVKSEQLLKPNGHMSLLVPSSVAKFHKEGEPSPALKKLSSLGVTSIVTGMEQYFKVGTEISQITFVKGPQNDKILFNGRKWDWKSYPWVPVDSDPEKVNLLLKLFSNKDRLTFVLQSHTKSLTVDPSRSLGAWGMNRGKDYNFMPLEQVADKERKAHLMCCEFETTELRDKALMMFKSPVYRFIKKMTMCGSDVSFNTLSSLPVPKGWENLQSPSEVEGLLGVKITE